MLNSFRQFFTPRTVVGLEVTPDSIGAVQVFNTLKGPEIGQTVYRTISGPEQAAEELKGLFEGDLLKHEILVTSLYGSSVFVRQLSLPFEKVRKVDKIVRFQMEPHIPLPIEEVVVDFLLSVPGHPVTTAAVSRKGLTDHLDYLSRAGLQPHVVTLDDVGLFLLYLHLRGGHAEEPAAIIRMGKDEVGIQVLREGRMDFIRILPGGGDDLEEIANSFRLYRLKDPEAEIRSVLVTGGTGEEGLIERLQTLLKIETAYWEPFSRMKQRQEGVDGPLQHRLCVPLGLALSYSGVVPKSINFRKEGFRVTSSFDLKRILTVTASLLLILGVLFTFNIYQRLQIQESRYAEVKHRIEKTFLDAFPDSSHVVKGQELAQMKQKIEAESGRFKWLDDVSRRGTVLGVLMPLTEAVKGFSDVRIDNLSVEEREIRIDGTAASFETVDKLKEKLTNTGSFGGVRLAGAKADKKDGAVRFSFGMEKKQ